ncbi:MAG: hypothetical protein AAF770_04015, partial [Bacteroidota bacterium]
MIKKPLLLVSLLLAPVFASQNIVDRYNNRVEEEGIAGRFKINNQGYMIFDGASSDQQLDAIGLTKGYGTGGIDPFKMYTYDEYVETGLHNYLINTLGLTDRWLRVERGKGKRLGYNLLSGAKKWVGDDMLEQIHEHEKKVSKRNEEWNLFFDNLVPKTLQALTNPKFALVVLLGTLILRRNRMPMPRSDLSGEEDDINADHVDDYQLRKSKFYPTPFVTEVKQDHTLSLASNIALLARDSEVKKGMIPRYVVAVQKIERLTQAGQLPLNALNIFIEAKGELLLPN